MQEKIFNWIGVIINIMLIIGLVVVVVTMFIKGFDYVYIVGTFLILFLPISALVSNIKKLKGELS